MKRLISTDELKRMYTELNMSTATIAKSVRMSRSGVLWRLHKAGVETREGDRNVPRGIVRADVVAMYVDQKLRTVEIAEKLGVSQNLVWWHLRKANVEFREDSANQNPVTTEELRVLYFDKGLSPIEIGKRFGMTYGSVCKRLRNAGFELRHAGNRLFLDPKNAPTGHPTIHDICWVAGIYEGEGSCVSPKDGAPRINVSVAQKDRWLCDRLRELFGGSITTSKRPSGTYYYWRVTGMRARGFVMTIYKFLSPRRQERIREALAA